MKIFVAGKFEEKERVRRAMTFLKSKGHEITCDWTQATLEGLTDIELRAHYRKHARIDMQGVEEAELFVLLLHEHGKGLWTELGMALMKHIPVIVSQPNPEVDAIYLYMPQVTIFNSDELALAWAALGRHRDPPPSEKALDG